MPVVHGVEIPSPAGAERSRRGPSAGTRPYRPSPSPGNREPLGGFGGRWEVTGFSGAVERSRDWVEDAFEWARGSWLNLFLALTIAAGTVAAAISLVQMISLSAESGPQVVESGVHYVDVGETLTGIAAEHEVSVAALLEAGDNAERLSDPDRIHPGQIIELP